MYFYFVLILATAVAVPNLHIVIENLIFFPRRFIQIVKIGRMPIPKLKELVGEYMEKTFHSEYVSDIPLFINGRTEVLDGAIATRAGVLAVWAEDTPITGKKSNVTYKGSITGDRWAGYKEKTTPVQINKRRQEALKAALNGLTTINTVIIRHNFELLCEIPERAEGEPELPPINSEDFAVATDFLSTFVLTLNADTPDKGMKYIRHAMRHEKPAIRKADRKAVTEQLKALKAQKM